jgi:hypothetical protein
LKRFRREVNYLARARQLSRVDVEREGAEANAHGRFSWTKPEKRLGVP